MTNTIKKVEFLSPYKQLRLVIEPIQPKTQWSPGKPGQHVQFNNGFFSTTDEKVVEFLRATPSYGVKYFENKGEVKPKLSPDLMEELNGLDETQVKALLGKLRAEGDAENASKEAAPVKNKGGRPRKATVVKDI